jgi:hypothetical protein
MVTQTKPLSETSTAVLGKMLVEILSGNLTDETLREVRALPLDLPQPFLDLSKQAGGSAITGAALTRDMLIELSGLCDELLNPPRF